jgi:hypothetical protein
MALEQDDNRQHQTKLGTTVGHRPQAEDEPANQTPKCISE